MICPSCIGNGRYRIPFGNEKTGVVMGISPTLGAYTKLSNRGYREEPCIDCHGTGRIEMIDDDQVNTKHVLQITSLMSKIGQLELKNKELVGLLKELEWIEDLETGQPYCVICDIGNYDHHKPSCKLKLAIEGERQNDKK